MKIISGKYFFPTTVCAGFLLVFSLWVVYEFIESISLQRTGRQKMSSLMANIVTEAVKCDLRKNNGNLRALDELFNKLFNSGTVEHIRIDINGETGIGINKQKKYIVDFGSDDYYRIQNTIILRRDLVFATDGKSTGAVLIFAFDSTGCFADIDSRGHLLLLFYLMGSVCISLLFLAWSYSIRNRELLNRVQSAKDRREHVDELGLTAAGLAHETKNPLGIIRGLAQNISDNKENSKKTRNMARDIMEETDVTTARLGDFLSYAKIRSPKFVEINTEEYLSRIISLVKDDFDNAGVQLITSIETKLILADQDMLSQILMNLLTNSLRFTKKGGRVTLSIREKLNKTAELKVEDTGAGIPADILPNIFKPYVTSSAAGYGIGLAIVKRITDQSGWTIKVDSALQKGTTITISNIRLVRNAIPL
jgi:signal transduction histidine kinase